MNSPIAQTINQNEQILEIATLEKEKTEVYYTLLKYFARITQFLAWPIAFVYFNLFFNLKIHDAENIRKQRSPFIIISNHVSFYDSFVFRLVLGVFPKNLPLRFMAVNSFKTWYLNFLSTTFITNIIYMLFGVFVVVKGRGIDKNLEDAVRIIKNIGNIVIYPEGSIMHDGKIHSFKLGAATLAKKTQATVIPVSMKITGHSFRRNFTIYVGEGINYDSNKTPEEISLIFRDTMETLHEKQ